MVFLKILIDKISIWLVFYPKLSKTLMDLQESYLTFLNICFTVFSFFYLDNCFIIFSYFYFQLKQKLRLVPAQLEKADSSLSEYKTKYDNMIQLKPVKEQVLFFQPFWCMYPKPDFTEWLLFTELLEYSGPMPMASDCWLGPPTNYKITVAD